MQNRTNNDELNIFTTLKTQNNILKWSGLDKRGLDQAIRP